MMVVLKQDEVRAVEESQIDKKSTNSTSSSSSKDSDDGDSMLESFKNHTSQLYQIGVKRIGKIKGFNFSEISDLIKIQDPG